MDALRRRHRDELTQEETRHTAEMEKLAARLAAERSGLSANAASHLLAEDNARRVTAERMAAEKELRELRAQIETRRAELQALESSGGNALEVSLRELGPDATAGASRARKGRREGGSPSKPGRAAAAGQQEPVHVTAEWAVRLPRPAPSDTESELGGPSSAGAPQVGPTRPSGAALSGMAPTECFFFPVCFVSYTGRRARCGSSSSSSARQSGACGSV